jgi:hypothetical protein
MKECYLAQLLQRLIWVKKSDTLNDNYNSYSLKMSLMNDDVIHPKNPISSIFNVEISLSFYHGFGHLLTNCPNRFNWLEVQPRLLITFPPKKNSITITLSYPNIVSKNFSSHSSIKGNRGKFLRFSNPTKNLFSFPRGQWLFYDTNFHSNDIRHFAL